jgi:hypothetical protein
LLNHLLSGTATTKQQVAVQTSAVTVLELSYQPIPTVLAQRLVVPLKVATAPQLLAAIARSSLIATLAVEAATAEAPTMEPTGGPVAGAIAAAEATRTATPLEPHWAATTPARRLRSYGARRLPRQATTTTSLPSPRDSVTSPSQRNSSIWESPSTTRSKTLCSLRYYALSIENAGGNNDTKCLYFPFCLDQAPLTWLESLEKYSIDKWDQLKEQFTSNFAGAMGRSGTRMDLAMVKQEQGETLRKYMRRFFDKRATVVDVSDKEVNDLF